MLKSSILRNNIVAGFNIAETSPILENYTFSGMEDSIRIESAGAVVLIKVLDENGSVIWVESSPIEYRDFVKHGNLINGLPILGVSGTIGSVTVDHSVDDEIIIFGVSLI